MTAELALTKPDPTMDHQQLRTMMEAAQRYVASGLLPAEVNTPQKALVVMTAGRELGVPATYALRNIHVVKGKPVCSAELLLALVRRTYGPSAVRVSKTDNTACTVQYREQGWDGISEYTFTIEDAKQAGVTGNNTWRQYPAAMLRARCISAVVRFAFPEAIAGLYTPEEMGAEVVVSDDGTVEKVVEVIDVTPTEPEKERAREMTGNGQSADEEAPFKYANVAKRYEACAEYDRLVKVAGERGHKDAAKVKAKRAKDLLDYELEGSIRVLRNWEAALPQPAEPDDDAAF